MCESLFLAEVATPPEGKIYRAWRNEFADVIGLPTLLNVRAREK